jgi:SRSO17 transposase
MTNLEGKIQQTVGNTYGLRTWIEYGFKHAKNELGWADYRVTDYASIERWWELVRSRLSAGEFAEPRVPACRPRALARSIMCYDRFS